MEKLLDTAPCGFLSLSDDGTILRANATLGVLLGYESGDLHGLPFHMILAAGGRVFCQTHLFPLLLLHGKAEEIYLSLRSRAGADVPVLLCAARRELAPDAANGGVSDCVLKRKENARLEAKHVLRRYGRDQSVATAVVKPEPLALDLYASNKARPRFCMRYRIARRSRREYVGDSLIAWDERYTPGFERRSWSRRIVHNWKIDHTRRIVGQADGVGRERAQMTYDLWQARRRQEAGAG